MRTGRIWASGRTRQHAGCLRTILQSEAQYDLSRDSAACITATQWQCRRGPSHHCELHCVRVSKGSQSACLIGNTFDLPAVPKGPFRNCEDFRATHNSTFPVHGKLLMNYSERKSEGHLCRCPSGKLHLQILDMRGDVPFVPEVVLHPGVAVAIRLIDWLLERCGPGR